MVNEGVNTKFEVINGWTKNAMVNHIKANFKGKSMTNGKCFYRSTDGRECAVGLFIPDSYYTPDMEHKCASSLLFSNRGLELYMPLPFDAMETLQMIHDESDERETLNDMLRWIEDRVE